MERVIFTLAYDKKWECWMIYAVLADDLGDFFQSTGRYAGEEIEVHPVVREVYPLIRKYDTPDLFVHFGKKKYKDEREFLRKVDTDYIREHIRPYIEQQVSAIIDILADRGFPLYMRGSRLDNFYKNQRIQLSPLFLRALLSFERTGEFTRYVLRLTDGQRIFYPADYQLEILSRQPCRVLVGKQLFRLPGDFDGHRLSPFLQKKEIMIPKANELLYFKKFILKHVRHDEIEVKGFEVIVHEVSKRTSLSLERNISGMPVLELGFHYGKQWVPAWSGRKALVELHTEGDSYAFYKVNRDEEWETKQEELLLHMGLKRCAPGIFILATLPENMCKTALQKNNEEGVQSKENGMAWEHTITWMRNRLPELEKAAITLSQKSMRRPYYIGNWQIDTQLYEETDWFGLKAEVVLADGSRIPLVRFREHLLAGKKEYVLADGSIFLIPDEWFSKYTEFFLLAEVRKSVLTWHKNQYALLEQAGIVVNGQKVENEKVELPAGLRAVLRPYQQSGYEWLYHLYLNKSGGCLADDMGLGKTVQAIALLLKYREEAVKPRIVAAPAEKETQLDLFDSCLQEETGKREFHTCLIVVPASLVHNWKNEIRKFAPHLTVTVYAGHNRHVLRPYLQRSDVVVVTYHTLRNDIDYLSRLLFGIVVADEAQMLKNPGSQVHQAMLRIQGTYFYALSGTPVENSLTDLWAVMNFTNRNMLGHHSFFRNHFMKPVLADLEGQRSRVLQKMIAPYILRRTKEEVLTELPELTAGLVVCEPDDEQQRIYEKEQSSVRNYILGRTERSEGLRNDFIVLKALIRLRQIANHPRLTDAAYTGGSGKFNEVFRMLKEVTEAEHKVLVFSSFVKYLEMVADEARQQGWKYAFLTGATSDREQEIRQFTDDPACKIFFISLKAGGVGLNLTAADYVFILDPWWNLAAENQAVGRAHRIGQKRAVFAYRFITAGTLEEKILLIQQRKQQLADAVIASSALVPLTDEELMEVI